MRVSRIIASMAVVSLFAGVFADVAVAQPKSRSEVKRELMQAYHDGLLPGTEANYPPSERLIRINRETHLAVVHPGETNPPLDKHDGISAIE